jgi:hypothetical protein
MGASVSQWGADTVANLLTGNGTFPAALYVALCKAEPDPGYDGTVLADLEPTGGYARQSISMNAASWDVASSGVCVSKVLISYPAATLDWGSINHWALCTALTAGEVFGYGEFDLSQRVLSGAIYTIPIGGLSISVSGRVNQVVM